MEPPITIHDLSVGSTILSADSLLSMERLDRSSPELWPEKIPGMQDYAVRPGSYSKTSKWMNEFIDDDYELLNGLSKMSPAGLVTEVKKLYDAAYQLGLEESREMTRGKYLKVLLKVPKQESDS